MWRHPSNVRRVAIGLVWLLLCSGASAQGIRLVTDSSSGQPVLYPSYITEYQGLLYFRGSNYPQGTDAELWSSDGLTAQRVADINPGGNGSSPSYLAVANDKLYFGATTAGGTRLWQFDTVSGAALAPGSAAQASNPEQMTAFGTNLYFRAFRSNIGTEFWSFNGASQTPIDMYPNTGSSFPQHFTQFNGKLYFNANGTAGQGSELWRYSGSGVPTEAARIYPNNGSSPEHLAEYQGELYFSAYDGVHGRELWKYDGAAASLVADIVPGPNLSSNPTGLTAYDGKLYFSASDPVHGTELWSFDGMSAQLVGEINPTPDPGNGDTFMMDSSPADLTVFEGKLFFSANDGAHGRELWSYDGNQLSLVNDINPGQYGSEVSELTVYNGELFFSADNGYAPGLGTFQPKVYAYSLVPEPSTTTIAALGAICLLAACYVRTQRAADKC